jgi:hypothetical protein
MYSVNAGETHETVHGESGMRYHSTTISSAVSSGSHTRCCGFAGSHIAGSPHGSPADRVQGSEADGSRAPVLQHSDIRRRRLVLANVGRVEQRAAEHRVEPAHGLDFAVVRDVRRLAEAETWVEVTPKRLSALHAAGLPA